MQYLLDTGILLRLVNRQADQHDQIREAVRTLKAQGHSTVCGFQNRAEFWNVCTRPTSARGGLGLTSEEALRRLRLVERITSMVPDTTEAYRRWRELLLIHGVRGVQVHDARLVALMMCAGITQILTLNKADFARYSEVTAISPGDVLASVVGRKSP